MPYYNYTCNNPICNQAQFDARISIADRNKLQPCPSCGKGAKRKTEFSTTVLGADTGGRNGKPTLPRDQ